VGHCNPKISSKVSAQSPGCAHFDAFPHRTHVALAEKIAQITPGNLQQSFFTNSGTEATKPPFCSRACPLAILMSSRYATPIPAARH